MAFPPPYKVVDALDQPRWSGTLKECEEWIASQPNPEEYRIKDVRWEPKPKK